MAIKKYISLGNLTSFFNNLKDTFATKTEMSGKSDKVHTHAISEVTNLQTSLDSKQATITGGASTITSSNLTTNRVLVSNSSGKVTVSDITSTELGYLDGTKSNIQTQLDNKAAKSHAHTVANISDLKATATELNYMDGVTSSVQTQLDGKAASGHTHNYAGSSSAGGAATSANKLNTNAGSATQPVYFANGVPVATTYTLAKSVPSNAIFTDTHYASKNVVGATNATSNTATALTNGNVYINSVENGAVTSSHKISGAGATTVTTDTSGNIVITSTDNNTTYSAAGSALGLVKSGGDVSISSGVITVNDDSHNHTIANIDNLQSSLDAKQATITGGASTIVSSNLTASRALVSDGSGKVAVSAVTGTELGYLDGVTSNVQTQLDGKAASSHGNHVPATQTANNAKFLRNDNTWQTVTPANIGAATSGHTHISLSGWSDTRSVDTVPNDYNGKLTVSGLKSNSTIGLSGGGIYSGVVGFRSWNDSSGGNSQEIAFAANGNLYRRYGSTTEWGDWLQFIDSGNIGSQSVASATKATQDASGNVITSTYETKANASSKLTEAKTYTDTVASGKANSSHTHDDRYYTETEINTKVDTLNSAINGKANASHTHSYAGSSSVGGDANNALKLQGYTRNNLYTDLPTWISAVGLTHTITVEGDKDTYYPVRIYLPSSKAMPTYISIHKNLGTKTPDIAGNHSNGTSSMWLIYEGRNRSWDGNGGYLKTWYKYMGYAELCSHTEVGTSLVGDLIVWLRGGGCTYEISKTNGTTESAIYYEETNLGSDAYPYVVAPRTDLGNKGVYRSTLGYGNIDGNASTATNVAWSGVTSKPSYYDAKAIKGITRSGTTFTYTCMDGTTGTFTQQDNNTTYSVATTSANGLMSSTDKSKLDGIVLATVSEVETYLGI